MNDLYQINKFVENTNNTDFHIQSFDGVSLLITGSFDFCYYHSIEIEFLKVTYISLPTYFEYPFFRNASVYETDSISNLIALHQEDRVYCIEAETSSSIDKLPFFIVAENFEIREGTVYYYKRENLKDNERIASWVTIN